MINDLPKHKCSLYIQHNDHKSFYESVESWVIDNDDMYSWKSVTTKQEAIDTDSVWTIQWYPDTPIGFISLAAPTLESLLEFALLCENDEQ